MGKTRPETVVFKPLTNAECIERWRKRHERNLARKEPRPQRGMTDQELAALSWDDSKPLSSE